MRIHDRAKRRRRKARRRGGALKYTDDTNRADHKDPFLYVGDSAVWWDTGITTNWRGSNPVRESEYELGDVDLCWLEQVYKEERSSGMYPCLRIYIGGTEEIGVTFVVFVDLEEERVIHVGHDYRRGPPLAP
ncbi:MAG: hypothetical protein IBX41_00155 [Methanophagales archaeon]|nr:hypothetical protein [Methanophagales archaeon]